LIKQAKAYAEKPGRSLLVVIEHFLKAVTNQDVKNDEIELPQIVKSLIGTLKMPEILMINKN